MDEFSLSLLPPLASVRDGDARAIISVRADGGADSCLGVSIPAPGPIVEVDAARSTSELESVEDKREVMESGTDAEANSSCCTASDRGKMKESP